MQPAKLTDDASPKFAAFAIINNSYRISYNIRKAVKSIETRIAKINISHAGGTASKSSKTCKVTLPNTWLEQNAWYKLDQFGYEALAESEQAVSVLEKLQKFSSDKKQIAYLAEPLLKSRN